MEDDVFAITKNIKVTKCDTSSFWYAKHIGQEFKVVRELRTRYEVKNPEDKGGSFFYVIKKDCEHVN